MWQKCPICNGKGTKKLYEEGVTGANLYSNFCHTCNGTGIINELTGLTPKQVNVIKSNISTDFRDDSNIETQQEYFGK